MAKVKIPVAHIEGAGAADESSQKRTRAARTQAASPSPHVETRQPASEPAGEPAAEPVQETHAAEPARGPLAWLTRAFPGHEHAVFGGLLGLLVAVSVFVFGFWRTLFVAVLVVAGIAVGQCLDGDARIVRALRRLVEPSPEGEDEAE